MIIIFNVRAKYTAIGRKEMLFFLYLAIGLIVSSLIVDCGVSPPSSTSYAYFVAVQIGFLVLFAFVYYIMDSMFPILGRWY